LKLLHCSIALKSRFFWKNAGSRIFDRARFSVIFNALPYFLRDLRCRMELDTINMAGGFVLCREQPLRNPLGVAEVLHYSLVLLRKRG